MAPVATRQKKKNKAGSITAEALERIVAAALENPSFGADRLAQLLRREGMDVSRSMVYRALRARGLQTRALRARFLSEQNRLRELADSRQPREAVAPAPPPDVREQPIGPPGPSVSIPGIEYAPPPVTVSAAATPGVRSTCVASFAAARGEPRKSHPETGKWLFRGVNLLLASLLVYLGVRNGSMLYHEWQAPPPAVMSSPAPASAPTAIETAAADSPLRDYRVIADRGLFGVASRPASDAEREAVALEKIGIAGNDVGLRLLGTTISSNRLLNHAVVEVTKNRSQEIVSEGDRVAAVVIKRIVRNNVIIQTAGGEKRLTLDEKPVSVSSAPREQSAVGINAPAASPVEGGEGQIAVEISSSVIAQTLPEIMQRLEGPNRSTNRPAGRPDGFYLSRVVAADALYRLGLRTGDVIKSVDGETVDSLDDAEVLTSRLAEGGEFSILIERQGQPQRLNLSIK